MTSKLTAGTLAAVLVLAAAPIARAQQPGSALPADPVRRIVPRGKDGDSSYYQVRCRDGSASTLELNHATVELCAQPRGAARRCARDWTLAEAASFVCERQPR